MTDALITGSGMVATALLECAPDFGIAARRLARREADLTDPAAVERAIRAARPEVIIHTAAETRVDYCESHPEQALRINALGTVNVRNVAAEINAGLVYLSTDYVFDGDKSSPWLESDEPNPVNAYGISKLAGEWAVQAYERGRVVRTSGVFGSRGDGRLERNFFRAIAGRLAADASPVQVVDDLQTAISYAPHLARMLLQLIAGGLPQVVHLTSAGQDSWYGWARRAAVLLGYEPARIAAVSAEDISQRGRAPRPRYSVLGSDNAEVATLIDRYPAEAGLEEYCASIA
jgi:dTDP-4-dehydrorhamnose reductase